MFYGIGHVAITGNNLEHSIGICLRQAFITSLICLFLFRAEEEKLLLIFFTKRRKIKGAAALRCKPGGTPSKLAMMLFMLFLFASQLLSERIKPLLIRQRCQQSAKGQCIATA